MRTLAPLLPLLLAAAASAAVDRATPGPAAGPDGGVVVSTRQLLHPAGRSYEYGSRPLDLALSPDGRTVYVKSEWGVLPMDAGTWKPRDQFWFGESGGTQHGIAASADGRRLWVTVNESFLLEGLVDEKGAISYGRYLTMPSPDGKGAAYPLGVALAPNGRTAWVCLSRGNSLAGVNLESGTVFCEIPVGVAPYGVVLSPDGKTAWVSNWGGRRPLAGERTMVSSGTPVLVDGRDIAATGTVTRVDLAARRATAEVRTGLHPSGLALAPDGARLFVACAGTDAVDVLDTASATVLESVAIRPDPNLPFGAAPNAVCLAADGRTLFVAAGGVNAVAIVDVSGPARLRGFVPAGWYPGAVATDGKALFIANVQGIGTRNKDSRADAVKKKDRSARIGWHDSWVQGTVTRVPLPLSGPDLAAMTKRVRRDGRVPEALASLARAATGVAPVTVPARAGEPSTLEHVVYVIKENRTYDQVLGDLPRGNNEPRLCTFGRKVTPNQHALAEEFVLLDNYYCNGVISSDGHAWADEANVSPYLHKMSGGWTRTYDYGTDPLAFSSCGPIWENAIAHGVSFRNYGETDDAAVVPDTAGWTDIWADWKAGTNKITFTQGMPMTHLRSFSCPTYPGWKMSIPDQVRADRFLAEFKEAEKTGSWPRFVILYLPNNHTEGTSPGWPTPRAMVADNDLALGRIVEAITRSRFWKTTAIFVNEDDPQDGYDHVDGHRSPCLVISPYSRTHKVVSEFYNQTSVLRTMELILGLPPMTQFDAMAPVMTACFAGRPDARPWKALPALTPLDELNPPKKALGPDERHWAELSERQDFSHPDRIHDDSMNRILWASQRPGESYPVQYAGAHGKGLPALGLSLEQGTGTWSDPDGDGD